MIQSENKYGYTLALIDHKTHTYQSQILTQPKQMNTWWGTDMYIYIHTYQMLVHNYFLFWYWLSIRTLNSSVHVLMNGLVHCSFIHTWANKFTCRYIYMLMQLRLSKLHPSNNQSRYQNILVWSPSSDSHLDISLQLLLSSGVIKTFRSCFLIRTAGGDHVCAALWNWIAC